MPPTAKLHDIEVVIPTAWEDHTVYRFALPADDTLDVALRAASPKPRQFRANVIIAKIKLVGPFSLETAFDSRRPPEAPPAPPMAASKVGSTTVGSRAALWRDSALTVDKPRMQLFQRELAIAISEREAVLITLTSDQQDLDSPFEQMGIRLGG